MLLFIHLTVLCAFSKKNVECPHNWEITGIYLAFHLHSFVGMEEKKLLRKSKLAIFLKSNEKELHFLAGFQNCTSLNQNLNYSVKSISGHILYTLICNHFQPSTTIFTLSRKQCTSLKVTSKY